MKLTRADQSALRILLDRERAGKVTTDILAHRPHPITLRRLVARGLVEVSEHRVKLTDQGRAVAEECERPVGVVL